MALNLLAPANFYRGSQSKGTSHSSRLAFPLLGRKLKRTTYSVRIKVKRLDTQAHVDLLPKIYLED